MDDRTWIDELRWRVASDTGVGLFKGYIKYLGEY